MWGSAEGVYSECASAAGRASRWLQEMLGSNIHFPASREPVIKHRLGWTPRKARESALILTPVDFEEGDRRGDW